MNIKKQTHANDVHLTPSLFGGYGIGEYPHETGPDCWCGPAMDYEDPETGAQVWVHNRPN